jgi:hypothetical protein
MSLLVASALLSTVGLLASGSMLLIGGALAVASATADSVLTMLLCTCWANVAVYLIASNSTSPVALATSTGSALCYCYRQPLSRWTAVYTVSTSYDA